MKPMPFQALAKLETKSGRVATSIRLVVRGNVTTWSQTNGSVCGRS